VSAIPYTPASGVRLLSKSKDINKVYPLLLQSIEELCRDIGASSYHCLFSNSRDIEWLRLKGLCLRHDCQFHWRNDGYNDFDDFLQTLKSKKRKNIRRERRLVSDSGVYLRLLNGHNATHIDWKNFNNFYQRTFLEKSGMPTLNLSFFEDIAKKIPDQIVLILADLDGKCVAGSLMFSSDTRLYGRHWGCIEHIDNLHFEACYYKGIDYCIENKLDVFEPGAQGEHKVSRGFLPTLTRSAHLIIDDNFKEPISSFCKQEQQYIEQYIQEISSHSPYKGKATC
ncbi:MAG: GNAT family N-acetyltransferase, partial [Candidatus Thioglobus sp.]